MLDCGKKNALTDEYESRISRKFWIDVMFEKTLRDAIDTIFHTNPFFKGLIGSEQRDCQS